MARLLSLIARAAFLVACHRGALLSLLAVRRDWVREDF